MNRESVGLVFGLSQVILSRARLYSSGKCPQYLLHAIAQRPYRIPLDAIVDPLAYLFTLDEAGFTQQAQVMGNSGLLDRNCRFEITDANATFIAREHVKQLQPYGVCELLEVRGDGGGFTVRPARPRRYVATTVAKLAINDFEGSGHTAR